MHKSIIWYNLLNSNAGWLLSDPFYEKIANNIINNNDFSIIDSEIDFQNDVLFEVELNIINEYSKLRMFTPDDIHESIPSYHILRNLYSLKEELLKTQSKA